MDALAANVRCSRCCWDSHRDRRLFALHDGGELVVVMTVRHVPVMCDRVVALLAPALVSPGAVVVDATVGLGGHSEALLRALPHVHVIGLDRDEHALRESRQRLDHFGSRITLIHAVYDQIPEVLAQLGIPAVQGILFDLGVSSMQLDEGERGFAYSMDAPLDMRMDSSGGVTAEDVVNTYSVPELARVLREYGEEKFALRIARLIEKQREVAPITRSSQLVDIVREAIPAPARRTGGNPAKRTFQALRIEVNDELRVLERAIPSAMDALAVSGRIVVMSYQSLEDRIVKREFASRTEVHAPHDLPVVPENLRPKFTLVTRGAEKASDQEVAENSRAASVRVRVAERIAA